MVRFFSTGGKWIYYSNLSFDLNAMVPMLLPHISKWNGWLFVRKTFSSKTAILTLVPSGT